MTDTVKYEFWTLWRRKPWRRTKNSNGDYGNEKFYINTWILPGKWRIWHQHMIASGYIATLQVNMFLIFDSHSFRDNIQNSQEIKLIHIKLYYFIKTYLQPRNLHNNMTLHQRPYVRNTLPLSIRPDEVLGVMS